MTTNTRAERGLYPFWELPFEFPAAMDHADKVIAGFRLRRNQLEAEKSDEPAHD
jgi:hypothetical protein